MTLSACVTNPGAGGTALLLGEALQGQVALVSGQKWQPKLTLHESGSEPRWAGSVGLIGGPTPHNRGFLVKIVGIYLMG